MQEKTEHTGEEWVAVARHFGEESVKIQHDTALSAEQKVEKQKELGDALSKQIEEDQSLKPEEKKQMIDSTNNYTQEWNFIHDSLAKEEKAK